MYCLVSIETHAYKIIRIKQGRTSVQNIILSDWIDMMDINPVINLKTFHAEIASIIADYYVVTYLTPFWRPVIGLVKITMPAKCLFTDYSGLLQISITFFERRKGYEFRIGKNQSFSNLAIKSAMSLRSCSLSELRIMRSSLSIISSFSECLL